VFDGDLRRGVRDAEKEEVMPETWVIQYSEVPHCWIMQGKQRSLAEGGIDVTWQLKQAKRFTNIEDARHEILRIGLSRDWLPIEISRVRGPEREKEKNS
jgi:hypothetical protein